MNKFLILIFFLSSLNVFAGTNEIAKLDEEGNKIVYQSRNYIVKSSNNIERIAQTPRETMIKKTGNCADQAILIQYLAEKEGLKAELKYERKGSHLVCIVTDGVKKYKYSNGRRRL